MAPHYLNLESNCLECKRAARCRHQEISPYKSANNAKYWNLGDLKMVDSVYFNVSLEDQFVNVVFKKETFSVNMAPSTRIDNLQN